MSASLATGCGPAGWVLVAGGRDVCRLVVGKGVVVVRCVVVRFGDVVAVVGSGVHVVVAEAPELAAGWEPPKWLRPIAAMTTRTTATSTIATMGPREGRLGGGWPCQALVGGGITGATTGGRDQFTGGGATGGGGG
ncbi:hypothetical protein GCM10018954_090580 [Kutzneria kofuensis]